MSMKTSAISKSKPIVLIVSLLLHALILWFITSGGDAPGFLEGTWFESRPPMTTTTPIVVEVVEMPTAPKDNETRPKDTTAFSERDHTTERETYPEKGRRTPPAVSSSEAAKKEVAVPLKDRLIDKAENKTLPGEEPSFISEPLPKFTAPDKDTTPRIFPSRDRLSALSERYERETPVSERGKVLNINTSELKYQKYVMNMKRRIEFFWRYPSSSIRSSEQGRLKVNFKITKDGAVRDVDVIRSSNYPALDDAAVTAIRLASPFNPLPGDFGVDEGISIRANFEYELLYPKR
jgi:TonB family protein